MVTLGIGTLVIIITDGDRRLIGRIKPRKTQKVDENTKNIIERDIGLSVDKSEDTGAGTLGDPVMKKLLSADKPRGFEVFGVVDDDDMEDLEEDINDVEKQIKASPNPVGKGFWKIVPAIYREFYVFFGGKKD